MDDIKAKAAWLLDPANARSTYPTEWIKELAQSVLSVEQTTCEPRFMYDRQPENPGDFDAVFMPHNRGMRHYIERMHWTGEDWMIGDEYAEGIVIGYWAHNFLAGGQTTGEGLRELVECLQWYIDTDETNIGMAGNEEFEAGKNRAIAAIEAFNRPSAKPGTQEVTAQEFAKAIDEVRLCVSSSRRGSNNGLRNAEELYEALGRAGIRLVRV